MSETFACPHCDSARVEIRNPNGRGSLEASDDRWRCAACKETFDDGVTREVKNKGSRNVNVGLAAKLDDADPSEVAR